MKHYLSNLLTINLILGVSLNLFPGKIFAQNVPLYCSIDGKKVILTQVGKLEDHCTTMIRCGKQGCGRGECTRSGNENNCKNLKIINPNNNTELKNSRPKISWRKVDGAINYIVRIESSSGEIWRFETKNNEIQYPDSAPELTYKNNYKLIVEAAKSKISVTKSETNFRVLTVDETKEKQNMITAKNKLIESGEQPDINYRELGEIYEDIGEIDLAKTNYSNAVIAAQKTGNLKAQALAEVRLMVITNDDNERKKHQQNAQLIYDKLGDKKLLEELGKLIEIK